MATQLFRSYGEFCASHPWEVIVGTLTLTACMLTLDNQQTVTSSTSATANAACRGCFWLQDTTNGASSSLSSDQHNAADLIVMTAIRCLAVLYSYYQFCSLHKLGSKYILGVAGLFTVFSSFVFTSTIMNFFRSDVADLKDALFFFLLLIDISKIAALAQFAMSAKSQDEIKNNISRGMGLLGPSITLDTIVETLVIGVGTLSGVRRLETLCYFACLSVLVNYLVFMTLYPACLSLILELSSGTDYSYLYNDVSRSLFSTVREENQKPNLVAQRIKLIMSAGLMLVHVHSRWLLVNEPATDKTINTESIEILNQNTTEEVVSMQNCIMKWLTMSADHIVILILLLALIVKFILFEAKDSIETSIRTSVSDTSIKSHKLVQTDEEIRSNNDAPEETATSSEEEVVPTPPENVEIRELSECSSIYKSGKHYELSDEEIILLVENKIILLHKIEDCIKNFERCVKIRRLILTKKLPGGSQSDVLKGLPYQHYDYSEVHGVCCENVIGYMPIPIGFAGPLKLDNQFFHVPMGTTEGCLVASTNRGCRAVSKNGITSRVVADGMTRGPVIRFPNLSRASDAMAWMENIHNFELIKEKFNSTSRFARLMKIHIRIAGRYLFVRFVARTGDAMGMNMISKATETAILYIKQHYFPDLELLSLSGNFCSDKKPAAVNWIEGRGKSVVCEAVVPGEVVKTVLKTSVQALIDVNISKNMVGSAIAGSIGGFNAHAANIVTAIYIATGQDPAQNVGSSNCMTLMEPWGEDDLYVTCSMPSIEIGTVGGGTGLTAQSSCLDMLGVKGANIENVGENANQLARIVCGTVLAGELSLMSALSAGHLVNSHLKLNRSRTSTTENC